MDSRFDQQPAWVSSSTAETDLRVRTFIRSVYAWMFGGLLLTAFAAVWVVSSPAMQQLVFGTPLRWVLLIAEFGLVVVLSAALKRLSPAAAASMFLVFSLINGLTLSVIFFAYTQATIFQAFVTAAGMFGAMSVYGMVTKRDLTSWGSFFFMGLIGLVIASIVNVFIHSSALGFMVSVLGVLVFVGLTAWDTQKLKSYATVTGPMQENLAIIGALALYLDFINLFLMLLRLFGGGDRRR
jgi:FtsH-binding integral membrane protein